MQHASAAPACPRCGAGAGPQDAFCIQCGNPLSSARNTFAPVFPPIYNDAPTARLGWFSGLCVESILGEGGMGTVYYAVSPVSKQAFALKVLDTHRAVANNHARLFESEAGIQSRLVHPNVTRLFQFVSEGHWYGLIMEYVPGPSLSTHLSNADHHLPPKDAISIAIDILDGLHAVHEAGYVHRDIKPGNVLLAPGRERLVAKLTDFGIASSLKDAVREAGVRGVTGTVPYLAPEQIHQEAPLGPQSDIFSFASMLYEMVGGHPPFSHDGASSMVVMTRILTEQAPDLRENAAEIPRDLAALIKRCHQKDPGQRPESAAEVRGELDAISRKMDA